MKTVPEPLQIIGGTCSNILLSIFMYIIAANLGMVAGYVCMEDGSDYCDPSNFHILDGLVEPYIYFLDEFNPTVALVWFAAHFVLVVKHLRGESSWILLFWPHSP